MDERLLKAIREVLIAEEVFNSMHISHEAAENSMDDLFTKLAELRNVCEDLNVIPLPASH